MNLEHFSGNRRSRRQTAPVHAPAMIESLETRALLAAAGPQVVSPAGTITDSTPVISWEAVDNAVSYDLWVNDVEARTVIFTKSGITGTNITAPSEFHLGRNRIWVKANFASGPSTEWGAPSDVILRAVPTVTGPANAAAPGRLLDTTPTVTWDSPPGAQSFDIVFLNLTMQTTTTYNVANLTPRLDANGNTISDGKGGVLREEIRKFDLPGEQLIGRYSVRVRSTDDAGFVSAWSTDFNFDVAPSVTSLRPTGTTFQNPPLLEWSPVAGATHYEVWVSKKGAVTEKTPLYSAQSLTTTSYQIPRTLADADYVFWVRAKRMHQVTEISFSEFPSSGSYQISLTSNGKTVQTGPINFDATPAQIKTAVTSLTGYESVTVETGGTAANPTFLVQVPQSNGPVTVSVTGSVSPGVLKSVTKTSPTVPGIWSDRREFTTFQNIQNIRPRITGPVGTITSNPMTRIVTDVRPTIEWTAIDKAARYEVVVDRTSSSAIYLKTTSSTNFYTFTSDLPAGNYIIAVRAISTNGTMSGVSELYSFTATAGAPIITSVTYQPNDPFTPTVNWTPVAGATKYEIWFSRVNVKYDYLVVSNLSTTSFTPDNPLDQGQYRIWVRAIKADGTPLKWSQFFLTTIADADAPTDSPSAEVSLAFLESELALPENTDAPPVHPATPADVPSNDGFVTEESARLVRAFTMPPTDAAAESSPVVDSPDAELIQQLAAGCVTQEWWTASEVTAS